MWSICSQRRVTAARRLEVNYFIVKLRATILKIAFTLAATLVGTVASAQYYSWGADPARFRWMQSRSENANVIYPQHASQIGNSTLYLTERMRPYIDYGFTLPPLDIPFVVHPENMNSNGLVMWLPKRVEFLSTPAIDSYSMPWIKQLVAHEYRHAAQYNNLNVGVVKFLSYLIGQQSSTIGLIFMPLWMMEGDATMSETQASSFGRGKQPRFSLEFRAMGNIADRFRNTDKIFSGSYRDYIPDHYQLGYQMVAHGNQLAGRIMANDMAALGPRRPWMIVSENWRMKHLFGFSTRELFRETFSYLADFWATIPTPDDSSTRLNAPRMESYTTYAHPIEVEDKIVMFKTDLDKPTRLVELNPETGEERRLAYTGVVATRPAYDKVNNRIWWSEYRRSTMFKQKVTSTLHYLDLGSKRPRTRLMGGRNALYPTPDDEGGLAWVEYSGDGIYTLRHERCDGTLRSHSLPFGQEVHSLAWDNLSRQHYCIITGDEGMWIARLGEDGGMEQVTRPAYITISNLRAHDGKLYFGSIESGRDEVHCLDLTSGKQYQISASTYGSFDPAPTDDGRVLMTTYDSMGYHPSVQPLDKIIREVEYSRLPQDVVNPKRQQWATINLDTVSLIPSDSTLGKMEVKQRRYRKGLHFFNFHSWAPLSYNPFAISEDGAINMNLGATVMTQNLLSSMQGFLSYGYSRRTSHLMKAAFRYYGLGPTISLTATYGGSQNIYPIYVYNPETHKIEFPETPSRGKFYAIGLDVQFPLMFQRGYHTRYLVADVGWEYSNGLAANTGKLSFDDGGISNVATIGYQKGIHLTSFSLGFQDFVRSAHRDFAPPWGIVATATYAMNPANGSFSDLLSLYAKAYTPGFARHNSFTLAMAYQTSIGGFQSQDAFSALTFKSAKLLPRGFDTSQVENRNLFSLSANYQLPLCYPDGGWRGIIYFKRIRLNAGFDIARYDRSQFMTDGTLRHTPHYINSWGGDLILDVNLLSQPAAATTALKLSFYQPSEGGFYFAAGMELPF